MKLIYRKDDFLNKIDTERIANKRNFYKRASINISYYKGIFFTIYIVALHIQTIPLNKLESSNAV